MSTDRLEGQRKDSTNVAYSGYTSIHNRALMTWDIILLHDIIFGKCDIHFCSIKTGLIIELEHMVESNCYVSIYVFILFSKMTSVAEGCQNTSSLSVSACTLLLIPISSFYKLRLNDP